MRVPVRFAPLLFSALLSSIMVAIVSGFVLVTNQGWSAELPAAWLRSRTRFAPRSSAAPWIANWWAWKASSIT